MAPRLIVDLEAMTGNGKRVGDTPHDLRGRSG